MAHTAESIRVRNNNGNLQLDWSYGFKVAEKKYRSVNVAIGHKIDPMWWDQKAQMPVEKWIAKNSRLWTKIEDAINAKRNELFNAFTMLYNQLGHLPSPEQIQAKLKGEDPTDANVMVRFVEWAGKYIDDNDTFSKGTKQKLKTAVVMVDALEQARAVQPFKAFAKGSGPIYVQTFSEVDWNDIELFIKKLSVQATIAIRNGVEHLQFNGGAYSRSTLEKFEQNIKGLLRAAKASKKKLAVDINDLKKVSRKPAEKHILDATDISKIINARFDQPYLENARKLMVVELMLGHRVGDWNTILNAPITMVRGDERTFPVLQFTNNKMMANQLVPVFKPAYDILCSQNRPHEISAQKLNDYAKEVCKALQIDRMVDVKSTRADLTMTGLNQPEPLHTQVSSHMFRRSITTLLRGSKFMIAPDVAAIMGGWKVNSKDAHWGYARMSAIEKAEMLVHLVEAGQHRVGFTMIDPAWSELRVAV